MAGHFQKHAINSTLDHTAGAGKTLLGTNVLGTALAELGYDNAGSTTAGEVPVRDPSGDVLVPATPSSAAAAASKGYVDSVASGLDPKASSRAATTAPLPANTYANGAAGVGATLTANANGVLPAQDGVTLVVGNRLLVKNEASGLKNGIYTVTSVGSGGSPYVLTRATDFDSSTSAPPKVTPGAFTFIEEGTTQASEGWVLSTIAPIVMGTTSLDWVQFTGAGEITPSDGIQKPGGNRVATKPATAVAPGQYGAIVNTRTADGTGVAAADAGFNAVKTDNATLEVDGTNQVRVKAGSRIDNYRGVFAYAAASPSAVELAAALTAADQYAHFKKGATDSVFHAFRRSVAAGGALADFALVELT